MVVSSPGRLACLGRAGCTRPPTPGRVDGLCGHCRRQARCRRPPGGAEAAHYHTGGPRPPPGEREENVAHYQARAALGLPLFGGW
jgi:hypothetical protein